MSKAINTISLDEFTRIFNYLTANNRRLIDEGKKPTAIGIEGPAGIGKTETIRGIAKANGMTFVKLNLAELEELGDLTGFPIKEYRVYPILETGHFDEEGNYVEEVLGDAEWVPADTLSRITNGPCDTYKITNDTRMAYATPAWLPRDFNENGTILLLDDYSRANSQFMQATMELVNEGKYISWDLPKYTTVVLTSNPDNGDYNVTALDTAQKSRMITFNVDFDVNLWAKWAEKAGIDGRAINFALFNGEQLFKNDGVQVVNARSYTTFCNAIQGMPDWSKTDTLADILTISKGCFTDDKNIVGRLFTMFIANKLDKLITPEDLLKGDWDTICAKAKACVYDNGQYRADIASVLATRFLNYSIKYFDTKGSKEAVVCDRLLKFVDASSKKSDQIFSEDLLFNISKTLVTKYPGRTNKLMMNAKIRKALM